MIVMGPDADEPRPRPLRISVGEFLNPQECDFAGRVRRFQEMEEGRGYPMPLDIAAAKKLVVVAREHLDSVMSNYKGKTSPLSVRAEHKDMVRESLAAITFGTAYQVIHTFLETSKEEMYGLHSFDERDFFNHFDNEMVGSYMDHNAAFPPDRPARRAQNRIEKRQWDDLEIGAELYGTAGLFEAPNWNRLPEAIRNFAHGLDVEKNVQHIATLFKNALQEIGSQNFRPREAGKPTSHEEAAHLKSMFGDFDPFA